MDYNMYLCPECNKVYKVQGENKRVQCSNCKHPLLNMKKTIGEWEMLTKEQKDNLKKKMREVSSSPAIQSISREKVAIETGVIDNDSKDNTVDSVNDIQTESKHDRTIEQPSFIICPKCGANIPEKSKFCLECGYSFEIKNVQAEEPTQNSFFAGIPNENPKTISDNTFHKPEVNTYDKYDTPVSSKKKKGGKGLVVLCSVLGVIVLVLAIVFVFVLRGKSSIDSMVAESVDPLSQRVIDKIDALGEIDAGDVAAIEEIKAEYSGLTDSQKDQVHNYIVILEAEDKIDELKEEKAHSEPANFIIEACTKLKSEMKNPDSFQISGIFYTDILRQGDYRKSETFAYLNDYKLRFMEIEFSAENAMGGRTTDRAYIEYYTGDSDTINIYTDNEFNNGEYAFLLMTEIQSEFRNVNDAKKFYKYDDTDFIESCIHK